MHYAKPPLNKDLWLLPFKVTKKVLPNRCLTNFSTVKNIFSFQIPPQPFSLKDFLYGINIKGGPHVAFEISADF